MAVRGGTERAALLAALAGELRHNWSRGRRFVAVDGPDGAGMGPFADELAVELRRQGSAVVRAAIDDFHRPRAEREARGRLSPEGRYHDSYDYSAFRRSLVEPFRLGLGASFVTAVFDRERDEPRETSWTTAPSDAILLVDGVFLNRDELRGIWNASVWLEVPTTVALERSDELNARNRGAQGLYQREASPARRATIVVDTSAPEHPLRIFGDYCSGAL